MDASCSGDLIDGLYSIRDLLDLNELRQIFEKFTQATGFTIGFLDHPAMNILIATGWRRICTDFHRKCPLSVEVCTRSNLRLLSRLNVPGQVEIEACEHGLVDCATPIIIKGKHVASLATGQLLLNEADLDRFREQARRYGYDEKEYLDALGEIQVVSEERLRAITNFLGELACRLSEQGYLQLETRQRAARLEQEMVERERAENALLESETRYRKLMELASDSIFVTDAETGMVVDANIQAQKLAGRALEELHGMSHFSLYPPDQAELSQTVFRETVQKGQSLDVGLFVLRRDGTRVPVEISSSIIETHGRRLVQGIFRDLTERRRTEEERHKLEAQMQQMQKLECLGMLAGGIAHDFNNLLASIMGNADMALQEMSPMSPGRDSVEEVIKASRRASDLCRQMLAYSGKGKFVIEPVDLAKLIEEMGHMLEVSISKKAVLRYHFGERVPHIEADATQIRQVLMNLIINASEAIGDRSGVISISTGIADCTADYLRTTYVNDHLPEGHYVYLEVADTGCGMSRETLARVFDPFFTTKFTGRGLGLAAVQGIVRGHHGAIKVYSEPGRGTTFKILFPAHEPVLGHSTAAEPAAPERWKGSGTILVADDEETVRAITAKMLRRAGFSVLTAADGREAVAQFRRHRDRIACILLDLTMPHCDGEESFRQLRALDPAVRVVLTSGYNEQESTGRFAGKGLAGFVQKPFEVGTLLAKIREVLAPPGAAVSGSSSAGATPGC